MYSWELELSSGLVTYGGNVADVLGFMPPQDLTSAQAFIHPDDADATRAEFAAAVQGERRFSFEHRVVGPNGASAWVHVSGFVLRDGSGAPSRLVGVAQNISERKRSEETIRESEARLRLVVDTVADYAIVTVDNSARIESWNPGAARAFGYEDREAIGQLYEILFTLEDRQKHVPAQELKEAVEHGVALDERWHLHKSGSLFYASGTMSPLRNTRGELTGFVKIARDLTERKQYEDALQRAHDELENRVLSRTRELAGANATLETEVGERRANEERVRALLKRLVTIQEDERRRIARDLHDHLGQQMTALRLNLAALKEQPAGDEAQELATQADRIAEQIDADVDFLAWELRPASLDDVGLAGTLARFVREWSKHYSIGAEFHTSGLTDRRVPSSTETNLYRIAQEAMNNVYKHAQASHVDVILERRDNQVVLIVEDDGIGFDPAAPRNTEEARGLGLTGMAERAMLAGGTLELETAPGRGATIFVRVPDDGLAGEPTGRA
jgi:PAS domain S-box-containing protein